MLIKKKIIYVLIAVTVFLLIVNLLMEKYGNTATSPVDTDTLQSVSVNNIDKKFENVLSLYGIRNEWIEKRKKKSTGFYYKIKIPKTVLIPNLIKDLNKKFPGGEVQIISEEENNYGNSTLKILSGSQTRLIAKFFYSKELKPAKVDIGFILYGIEDLSREELKELLRIPLHFGVVLLPDIDADDLIDEISDANKQYYLLLSEDIDDKRYELNPDFTKSVLRLHLNQIFKFYGNNKFFVIDKNSDLYQSLAFEYIAKVLKRNGKKLYFVQNFIPLKGESTGDLNSLFDFYLQNIKKNPKKIFYVNASDFQDLLNEILLFTKKGNGVRFPSLLLK